MKSITVTFVAIAGLGLCVAPLALATDDSFVGKWKFNPEKSQLSGLTYKVEEAGGDKYKFAFGDDSETITLGKDHPTKYGNTWTVTKSGPNAWKWMIKRNGKVISDATWTVSDDGATSTYVNTETHQDGSTSHNETKLKRTAGTSGLVGTWESTEIKIGSPTTMEIRLEIQLCAILDLYASIVSSGLELTRGGHLALTDLCTCRRHHTTAADLGQIVSIRLEISFLEDITLSYLLTAGAPPA